MERTKLKLSLLKDTFAVCKLDKDASLPLWVTSANFFSITKTLSELSIVCSNSLVPDNIKCCNFGWKCMKVEAILDFALTGILTHLTKLLSDEEISVFVFSTYNTDYIMVKEHCLERALLVLSREGHFITQ